MHRLKKLELKKRKGIKSLKSLQRIPNPSCPRIIKFEEEFSCSIKIKTNRSKTTVEGI